MGGCRVFTIFDQKFFFLNLSVILVEFCLLIPNIGPKVLNSVVRGDLRVFEVPLSYIGPLYNTRQISPTIAGLKSFLLDAYNHSIYDKKRIRRVPSCSRKRSTKNDLDITLNWPEILCAHLFWAKFHKNLTMNSIRPLMSSNERLFDFPFHHEKSKKLQPRLTIQ